MIRTALMALTVCLALPTVAHAQDDEASSRKGRRALEKDIVREIERGVYIKAAPGSQQFLTLTSAVTGGPLIRPVLALDLAVGQDFIDREKMSMAWEIELAQGLHNGPKYDDLDSEVPVVQGDIHTFTGSVFFEASGYLSRRFGVGLRAGGGMMMIPVLMERSQYDLEVVGGFWGGQPVTAHSGPLPTFGGGPTLEYYTKLSHFSIGADADVLYVLGLDIAIAPCGYFKYTF